MQTGSEPIVTSHDPTLLEESIRDLIARMTPEEKVGQLCQIQGDHGQISEPLRERIRAGRLGSILNEADAATIRELQRIAVEESRLGIPLLIGRDVIHGFKTVFPIPLGQAASWNPALVEQGARIAAREAAAVGINWTFAPMIDIGRDPRWGRVAECLGEDPYLTGVLGSAMVRGFQGDDLTAPDAIASCVKHFAGYGASEAGRDYNTTNIPEIELRNVHLRPFRECLAAGAATLMTSFSDLNGIPATANPLLLRQILREEWGFDGLVVSDWDSIRQLEVHGLTENERESAFEAATAGVDMEMASATYHDHLASLVEEGRLAVEQLDAMVANVLRTKFRLGLFEQPYAAPDAFPAALNDDHLAAARAAATESIILLTNDDDFLPLDAAQLQRIAVIGPLADDPYEQLGTWIFDGDPSASQTLLAAMRAQVGEAAEVTFTPGLRSTRDRDHGGFADAVAAADAADVVVMVLGEEAILSGEAHCRADITLPGAQDALLEAVAATGTPVVLIIMAGRPLALEGTIGHAAAVLYAWHPGTMAGPALSDLLFGIAAPSGRLPVTLPRVTGQIPIYYAHKHTGKPPTPESYIHIDDIEPRAGQVSVGNTSFHLDVDYTPLFPFGYGRGYSPVGYHDLRTSTSEWPLDGMMTLEVDIENHGTRDLQEVVQLYVRDLAASVTRPVRELKAFEKIHLAPGERRTVAFTLTAQDLAFTGRNMREVTEPGRFHAWVAGNAASGLWTEFTVTSS
jgi:beta-glucosidase